MAYRITGTTDEDTVILDAIRDLAWHERVSVSQIMREAFLSKLYGGRKHWPEEHQHIAKVRRSNRGDEIHE